MTPPPRKVYIDLPSNLTFDSHSGRYRYRNPLKETRTWLGKDKALAVEKANQMNEAVKLMALELAARKNGFVTVKHVVRLFVERSHDDYDWHETTRKNHETAYSLYCDEFGDKLVSQLTRGWIDQWIRDRCQTVDCRKKHRLRLIRMLDLAVLYNWTDTNEARMVPEYHKKSSKSERIRDRLSLDEFWKIHDVAPLFLQVAMQMSLITLQSRAECCNMKRTDIVDGRIRVIRRKTANKSDAAFIAIEITPDIDSILSLSLSSGIASPFIVHHRPRSMRPEFREDRPHWTYVKPQRLSIAFAAARDSAGVTEQHGPRQAPSFHEIRSLGARLCEQAGVTHEKIQELMTHSEKSTTEIYLDDPKQLKAANYKSVTAPLRMPSREGK